MVVIEAEVAGTFGEVLSPPVAAAERVLDLAGGELDAA